MKKVQLLMIAAIAVVFISSCKKTEDPQPEISTPQFQAGQTITSDTLKGSVKGTLQSGKTYYFYNQVTINDGDTLVMQSGVKLLSLSPNAQLIVKGAFVSLGTKNDPNWITGKDAYLNPSLYKL